MSDPIIPIIPQEGKGAFWHIEDLYVGPTGNPRQRYVPNVNDVVFDRNRGWFTVTHVDLTNHYEFTLLPWTDPLPESGIMDTDILLGSGPGYQSESFRLFVNDKTVPFSARMDGRLYIRARQAASVVIFKGTDITSNGERISAVFNQFSELMTNHIPLVDRPTPAGQETSIKSTDPFNITTQLNDGDIVTAVVYGRDNIPLSIAKLSVINTENVMHGGSATKYIESIQLESPFISSTDVELVEFPVNVLAQSAMFSGVVRYNDGSTARYPVDGTKFKLAGINSFIPSRVGQNVDLTLIYYLDPEENADLISDAGGERFVSKPYRLTTTEVKDSYSVALYVFPDWNPGLGEYELKFYMNNLERQELWDVTEYVRPHALNNHPFDGNLMGVEQELLFTVDLSEVDSIYSHFRHVQPIWITLLRRGTEEGQKWRVRYSAGGTPFGDNMVVTSKVANEPNKFEYDLTCGYDTFMEWLDNVVYNTEPIRHATYEEAAPQPTQFTVVLGNERIRRDIHQWEIPLVADTNQIQGKNIYLEFERATSTGVLQIGVSGIPVDRT